MEPWEYTISGYALAVLAVGALVAGLGMLMKGGDWTIASASFLARRIGLSELFIGATIIAFGTSVPELFTSVNANLSGYADLSLGNIVGSNIANILMILGATALIFTIQGAPKRLVKDVAVVVLATILLTALMLYGVVERWHGALMALAIIAYVIYQFRADGGVTSDETAPDEAEEDEVAVETLPRAVGLLVGGLVLLALGSEVLVQGAIAAGKALSVPEGVIGLTVVAFGTSLPELATCIVAARRHRTDLILGNILGSNVFNILWIVGITAAVKPLVVDARMAGIEMWVMVGVTAAFAAWMLSVARIGKRLGIAMVAAYLVFVAISYRGAAMVQDVVSAGG